MDRSRFKVLSFCWIALLAAYTFQVALVHGRPQRTDLSVGFVAGLLNPDLSALDSTLEEAGYPPLRGEFLLLGGMCTNCLIDGWQLGGGAFYGERMSKRDMKQATLTLELGGLFAAYAVWSNQAYEFSLGAFTGVGLATLELLDHQPETFESALSNPPSIRLEQRFIALHPYVSLGLDVTSRLSVRLYAGYFWVWGEEWWLGQRKLAIPAGNLSGYTVQIMLAFSPRDDP
jgi:hypothetical protein